MDLARRRQIGGVAWVGGLVLATIWGALDDGPAEGRGFGFAPAVEVAALETGRLLELPVTLHQDVAADTVVVRLDPAPLIEEREVVSARLLAVKDSESSSAAGEARRFAEGVQGVVIYKAQLATKVSEDRALLETLQERKTLEETLAQTGASSQQAVEEWARQIRVVEARVGATQRALNIASNVAKSAVERSEAAPGGNDWEVVAATRELEQMDARIARLDLHAGIEGQVTWIYRSPGEVVNAGEPVLQVRRTGTKEVVAFVQAAAVAGLTSGDRASVQRATGQVVFGKLLTVGVGPQPLPERLWHNPAYPEYGVPVRLELDDEIAPGEAVSIRL